MLKKNDHRKVIIRKQVEREGYFSGGKYNKNRDLKLVEVFDKFKALPKQKHLMGR